MTAQKPPFWCYREWSGDTTYWANGRRQYLSFHIIGDMPDAQGLFIDEMDHALCAVGRAVVALIPHSDIVKSFKARPQLGFAVWRETLIDAAIFREAITNNSGRRVQMRMAHLFCELFYRARASGVAEQHQYALPLNLMQLGEALGMAIATVNCTLQQLRTTRQRGLSRWRADDQELGQTGQDWRV